MIKLQPELTEKEYKAGEPIPKEELESSKWCIAKPYYVWLDSNGNPEPPVDIDDAKLLRKYCPEIFRDSKKQDKADTE